MPETAADGTKKRGSNSMSMGRKSDQVTTEDLFINYADVPKGPSHPFFARLDRILRKHDFDCCCEEVCDRYYAKLMGRPSIPPGVYFRMLMIGYFEAIRSERGIAWKVADSGSLKTFLGYKLTDGTPDHSSLSWIRTRLSLDAHKEVFAYVLEILRKEKLLKGKKIGLDASNVEANAAMRSIRRKIDGKRYEAYLKALAKQSGIEEPDKSDLGRFDRNRPDKSCSNKEWESPSDPDARVTKMKDGRTHLAYKAEHAMDLETGAMVSAVIHPANRGDTESMWETLAEAGENLSRVEDATEAEEETLEELVTDKGYHSAQVVAEVTEAGIRSYTPNRIEADRSGKASGRSSRPSTGTVLDREGRRPGNCTGDGRRSSRGASHTRSTQAACAASGFAVARMSGSGT